jgi:hypothetical protein
VGDIGLRYTLKWADYTKLLLKKHSRNTLVAVSEGRFAEPNKNLYFLLV